MRDTERDETVYGRSARAWDLAGTKGKGDPTAGVKLGILEETGQVVVRDAVSYQQKYESIRQRILDCALIDGPDVEIVIPQDPASAGKAVAEQTQKFLVAEIRKAGMRVPRIHVVRPTGKKAIRFKGFAAEARPKLTDGEGEIRIPGNVLAVPFEELRAYLLELHHFDGAEGGKDNFVDATSDAYNVIAGGKKPYRGGYLL